MRMYSYLTTSKGAGNCWLNGICSNFHISIATYLPREGPETGRLLLLQMFHLCIDTYLPREGTETPINKAIFLEPFV
ncbi:hypothetical protein B7700_09375 [Streptococcus mitis]|uniref:Uncharacterized protein n=1 Tax=Streptococcus mitis TaxID=28037 RepID=A0A1X1JXB2_STRMT|nr:hypothetical protein B7700_09375 [Streptococcus mitis]